MATARQTRLGWPPDTAAAQIRGRPHGTGPRLLRPAPGVAAGCPRWVCGATCARAAPHGGRGCGANEPPVLCCARAEATGAGVSWRGAVGGRLATCRRGDRYVSPSQAWCIAGTAALFAVTDGWKLRYCAAGIQRGHGWKLNCEWYFIFKNSISSVHPLFSSYQDIMLATLKLRQPLQLWRLIRAQYQL